MQKGWTDRGVVWGWIMWAQGTVYYMTSRSPKGQDSFWVPWKAFSVTAG